MISCRIVLNELPDDVLDQVLCVDEILEGDKRWRLLKHSPSSRTYHFTPKPSSKSWFVQWGFQYTWSHFKASMLGHDDATVDWENATLAARKGIPVARYRLLATPRLLTGSMDTLLAREFIQDACSVGTFLVQNVHNRLAVDDALVHLGELLSSMHACGLQHGNLTLDSILVQFDDPSRLTFIDWHDMRTISPDEFLSFRHELVLLVNDLLHLGCAQGHIETLLSAYARRMPLTEDRFDEILRAAAPDEPSIHWN